MTQYQFASLEDYAREFTNVALWKSAVERVCQQHQLVVSLSNANIRAGLPGTNPVFIINDQFLIKFYETHFFLSGIKSFQVECDLYKWLRLPHLMTPELIASGTLDNWPYIITTVIPGSSFGEMRTKINEIDRHALATLLGHTLRYLHQIPIDSQPILSQMRDQYTAFIEKQVDECVERHRRWNVLPEHLIQQIPLYIQKHKHPMSACLIHADITCDHILGVFDSDDEHWRATGLIDFADAWVGDSIYELVALHCSVFEFDKKLLNTFLQAYQLLEDNLVERAMIATLLFEFNIFSEFSKHQPELFHTATTLQELADMIWAIKDKQEVST